MKRGRLATLLAAAALLAACGEETRDGQLTLSGSAPLRIADESGKTVEFYSGPLTVEFGADGSRKFTVKLEQSGRSAKFSGRAPSISDWNFTVRGADIGQPADFTSERKISLYGPTMRRWGTGSSCGFNGRWETEETWRKGDEDWKVSFKDASSGSAIGAFASRKEGQDYLIDSRNVWCHERPERDRDHGRWDRLSTRLNELKPAALKFE